MDDHAPDRLNCADRIRIGAVIAETRPVVPSPRKVGAFNDRHEGLGGPCEHLVVDINTTRATQGHFVRRKQQMIEVLLPLLLLCALVFALRRLPQTLNAKRHTHRLSQPGEVGWTYEFVNKTFSLYTTAFNSLPKYVV